MLFQLLVTISMVTVSVANPTGAPTAACSSMTPSESAHGATTSEDESPYTVTVSGGSTYMSDSAKTSKLPRRKHLLKRSKHRSVSVTKAFATWSVV